MTIKTYLRKNFRSIYFPLKRMYNRLEAFVPAKLYAQFSYYKYKGKFLNLRNPQTYDEKIWWLKLNYFNPLEVQCTDKYEVRKYVEQCGLGNILNELYDHFYSAEEINFDKCPERFFLKCNHLSGGNLIVEKKHTDINRLKNFFSPLMKENNYYGTREWNYKDIKPCIIAEKILEMKDGSTLLDYKFMCFEGEPKFLFLDIGVCNSDGSHAEEYYRNIYDINFNPIDEIKETREHYDYSKIKKPDNYEYMVECARKLSAPFPHCRVDLYNVDGRVYFGEITFYHGSGKNDFQPYEADLMFGKLIPLIKYEK